MPELKSYIVVTNHNQSLAEKVFDHAIKLGYVDSLGIGDDRTTRQFVDVAAFSIESNRIGWWGIYIGYVWNDCVQISPEEFLKIGGDIPLKERLQSCKINLSGLSVDNMREVSLVLEENEISGYNSEFIVRGLNWRSWDKSSKEDGLEHHIQAYLPLGLYIVDGETVMVGTQLYFDSLPQPEIKVEELLKTKNKVMLKLNLEKQPQKAKNLTVGREYEGIYVDENNNQVDSFDDADYFLCVNNTGKEARYSIALFSKPEPVLPTFENAIDDIVMEIRTSVSEIGPVIEDEDVNCSCGITSFNGINSLYERIKNLVEDLSPEDIVSDPENFNSNLLIETCFRKEILSYLEDVNAFGIFSTKVSHPSAALMDNIAEEHGVSSEERLNPNSGNIIKVWVLTKPE